MKVIFYCSKPRELEIAHAMLDGSTLVPDVDFGIRLPEHCTQAHGDVAIVYGVKGHSRAIMDLYEAENRQVIYVDKGYIGSKAFHKVSIGGFQPLMSLASWKKPQDRLQYLMDARHISNVWTSKHLTLPHRVETVLFIAPSQKYANFHDLGDATVYATHIIKKLARLGIKNIIHRPKFSWKDAKPIKGAEFSNLVEEYDQDIDRCDVVITHGSNGSIRALLKGKPVVAIGPAALRPIVETMIDQIQAPLIPSPDKIRQWLYNVAYCQWSIGELRTGTWWREVLPTLL